MAAEPALTAGTAVASTVAAGAASIAFLGLHPADMVFAGIGALIGLASTESTNRARSIALFVLAAPTAALAAQAAAPYLPASNEALRRVVALLVAGVFPPLFVSVRDTFAGRVPAIVGVVVDRVLQVFGGTK